MAISIEKAAELGFHLVHEVEGEIARIERVVAAGTQVFVGETVEEALGEVQRFLDRFPGAPSHVSSRSDGVIESRDVQEAQSASVGTAGPSPAADAEAHAKADASTDGVDASGLTAEQPGEVATGRVDAPAEPEAPAAPEGTVQS